MSKRDKLAQRFNERVMPDGSTVQMTYMHVTWGPDAPALTTEQRAKLLNDVLNQGEVAVGVPIEKWLKENP